MKKIKKWIRKYILQINDEVTTPEEARLNAIKKLMTYLIIIGVLILIIIIVS